MTSTIISALSAAAISIVTVAGATQANAKTVGPVQLALCSSDAKSPCTQGDTNAVHTDRLRKTPVEVKVETPKEMMIMSAPMEGKVIKPTKEDAKAK